MATTVGGLKQVILNKWDWEKPIFNTPLFIWGPIGIGKTESVVAAVADRMIFDRKNLIKSLQGQELTKEQTATLNKATEELRLLETYEDPKEIEELVDQHMLVLRLAERPIEQLQGVPTPIIKDGTTRFLMPENMLNIAKAKWLVVFLDELDKADEAKMAAATHLIESRRVGDWTFPKDCMIICAANRVNDSWLSKPVVPELRNRGAHVDVRMDTEEWIKWAKRKNINKTVVRFIEYSLGVRKSYLLKEDGLNDTDAPNAFPTPRSWHKAARQISRLERQGASLNEIVSEIGQYVGEAVALEYKMFYELYEKIDVMAILEGKQEVPSHQNRKDFDTMTKQFAIAYAFCDQLKIETLENKKYLKGFIKALSVFHDDIRILTFVTMASAREDIMTLITSSGDKEIIEICRPYLKELLKYMGGIN